MIIRTLHTLHYNYIIITYIIIINNNSKYISINKNMFLFTVDVPVVECAISVNEHIRFSPGS